jgi:3-deoxy-manno-octulosonate cytidylyltransferase (CMP-KDO synthetase)
MFHVIIPARFSATRLPGKPLLEIGGRPLIEWVWQRACASGAASVMLATDDERIRSTALQFGADVVMTSTQHASGTDRIAEVARARGLQPEDIVVNLQGDEPMMPAAVISAVAGALEAARHVDIATAAAPVQSLAEFLDPNCVKAVCAGDGRALYFSRAPVPWPRDQAGGGQTDGWPPPALRHIGIYGYRVRSLLQFAAWAPTPLEISEKLEQLRALEYGMHIQVVTLQEAPPAGIDTPQDLERVRVLLAPATSAARGGP